MASGIQGQEVQFTHEELYQQDFPWTIIAGRVYAIGDFVAAHPGGPLIRRAIGEDATELFHTHHTTSLALRTLARYDIGSFRSTSTSNSSCSTNGRRLFQEELNRRIGDMYKTPKYPIAEIIACFMLCLFAAWALLAYGGGCWQLNITLTWFWCRHLDSGLHSIVHGDFRYSCRLNRALFFVYSTLSHRAVEYYNGDCVLRGTGMSKHFVHHVHTNSRHTDPDWTTMTGTVWVRRHHSACWQPCHRWQCLYWLPITLLVEPCLELLHLGILCLEHLAALMEPPATSTSFWKRVCSCVALWTEVLLNPGFQGIAFAFQPWWRALGVLLCARAIARLVLFPFSEVQHYMPELIELDEGAEACVAEEWAIAQLRRTANLSFGNPLMTFMDFLMFHGDSYQIEHHLWPSMSFVNLRHAAKIVRATCEEFGLPYHQVDYWNGYRKIWQQVCAHTEPPHLRNHAPASVDGSRGESIPGTPSSVGPQLPASPRSPGTPGSVGPQLPAAGEHCELQETLSTEASTAEEESDAGSENIDGPIQRTQPREDIATASHAESDGERFDSASATEAESSRSEGACIKRAHEPEDRSNGHERHIRRRM